MPVLNKKIQQRKQLDLPINYCTTPIGDLSERSTLLDKGVISGYGVVWSSVNDFGERFVKGAFSKSIQDYGPGSRSNYSIKYRDRHGKTCALMANLTEDDTGLYFETKPMDNVQWAKDMLTQVRSGSINNFSIGFKHCWDKIEYDSDNDIMINLEARLFEISGVDIPSDMETYAMRSTEEIEFLQEEVDDFITTLPRSIQLEARKIFARCMSLSKDDEPFEIRQKTLVVPKPSEVKGSFTSDLDFLIQNFKK